MKNTVKCCLFLFFVFVLTVSGFSQASNYTYNYDFWDEQVQSPDAFRVSAYVLGSIMGVGNFSDPQGLFIRDNRIYICDSGNNRVVVLEVKENGEHVAVRQFNSVMIDGVRSSLAYPMDVFETRDGYIYIADTNNNRILKLDPEWNYIGSVLRPNDESIGEYVEFLPLKLVVDFANRLFVQAQNVNKGLIEFDALGEFVGYMGANRVWVNPIDYLWKLLSTEAQKKRMDLFIPTEYNNICLDSSGFIYATNFSWHIEPVRRLNAMGQDILIRNGYTRPQGDLSYGNAGGISGRSRFIDVTAFNNESYACFDRTRGRIFMYDFQGNLLYAFGGVGNREGRFLQPVALEHMGNSIYALDSRTGALTRFDMTGYGLKINEALSEYQAGRYESSAPHCQEGLKMHGNYYLAYIGIGRAALRQGEYQKAMKFYKLKHYREGYSKAFQLYRKQFMEENLWKFLLVAAILIFVPFVVKTVLKIRKEVMEE
ncbi:MAG: hypothetical protein LBH43_09050 [Treponema sp.]|jgi:DNA-binding beta-propeller fold protein YncE|nr:hypothetical protein [Treponema sp.]